ncbi:MAG: peptide ABC transporter substrate-binding protein [bacterium]|nr:peptide ABC transporter substrate-binding protein [bacterium]
MRYTLPSRKEWQTLFDNLSKAERVLFIGLFLTAWTAGVFVLIGLDSDYSTKLPAPGGSITEGIVGTPRFINPLLAISEADRDLTRIIFSGLMKADGRGGLEPQLADNFVISEDGLTYTFTLKEHLYWHDNVPVTADDIAFTIELTKNPKIRSIKLAQWEGTEVKVIDEKTIQFILQRPFSPFLENTTLGIMPKHLWENIPAEQFALIDLNTEPIGSGPFFIESISRTGTGIITKYTLERFNRFVPRAHLKRVIVRFYQTDIELEKALEGGIVDAGSADINKVPKGLKRLDVNLPLIVGVFFNQDQYTPFKNASLREALHVATDRERIIESARGGNAVATSLPIPPGTFAHAGSLENTEYNVERARQILTDAGITDSEEDEDSIVEIKVSKTEYAPVRFKLATPENPEFVRTAELIKSMWAEIGVEVTIERFEQGDLEQSIIRTRDYDALLFGQVYGYETDPYGFWHTSQSKHPGSNIALYANTKVDSLLDAAHKAISRDRREELYTFFQEAISEDRPAVILYSPSYVYYVPVGLLGIDLRQIPFPQERFTDIEHWYIHTKNVWNIFAP